MLSVGVTVDKVAELQLLPVWFGQKNISNNNQ